MSRPKISANCVTHSCSRDCVPAPRRACHVKRVCGVPVKRVKAARAERHFLSFGPRCVLCSCCLCFYVGGNLLSHTLPSAVPSARAGLASGFGMGPGVSLPLSTTDKHPRHATCVALTWRVLCQILHSGREQQELFILSLHCVAPKPFLGLVCVCFGLLVPVALTFCNASRSGLSTP